MVSRLKVGDMAVFKPRKNGVEDTENPQFGKEVYILQAKPNEKYYGIRVAGEDPVYYPGGEVLQWATGIELEPIEEDK